VLHHLGDDGYLRLTESARRACERLTTAIDETPALRVIARPDATLVAFTAADADTLDVFAVADALWRRGWYVDRQGPPASLHCTVNAIHDGRIDEFVGDLRASVDEVLAVSSRGEQGAYGTVE